MKESKLRIFLIPLVSALVIYFVGFYTVEHMRYRKGPWEVQFTSTNGVAALLVNQPTLGISDVSIVLQDEAVDGSFTNSLETYELPREVPFPVPHGRVVYLDMTFLPGTVTFDLRGHAIELLPRALLINGDEYAWKPGLQVQLDPMDKKNPVTPKEFLERLEEAQENEKDGN